MKLKTTVFIYFDTSDPHTLHSTTYDMWAHGTAPDNPNCKILTASAWYLLDSFEHEFESNFNAHEAQISGLEAALKKEIADSHVRQERFKEEIGRLKCLTHEPVVTDYNY